METVIRPSVFVKGLKLRVIKGLYPEEQWIANEFSVSAELFYDPSALRTGEFVDYTSLAGILEEVMNSKENLLEKCAENIIQKVRERWGSATEISVRIEKMNPPFLGHVAQAVGVSLVWKK